MYVLAQKPKVSQDTSAACPMLRPRVYRGATSPFQFSIASAGNHFEHERGQPIASATRGFMESRFRRNFSKVRIHTNTQATESARNLNATAYTVNEDIVFASNHYRPDSRRGSSLLAHELTHVVQNQKRQSSSSLLTGGPQNPQAEKEADAVSGRLQLGMRAGPICATNTGIAMTPASVAVEPLLSYSGLDWAVTNEDERDILGHLTRDTSLSTTITDLNASGMLSALINRVDSNRYRRQLLQLLGASLNRTAHALVEPLIVGLGRSWELQYNLGRLGSTRGAPAFNTAPFAHLSSGGPSTPFTGSGATGVNPTTLDIGYVNQGLLAAGHAATVANYSNPIPGSLPAYLAGLSATDRSEQAELMLRRPISTIDATGYNGHIPSRAQIITVAANAHNLHPELIAAFLLAEQRDQSRNEDAKDYLGARSHIMQGNTSLGLGQVVVSTAQRGDLFEDTLSSGTRSSLSHRDIAELLVSDEYNILAAARYIRQTANTGATINIATLPNTQAAFPAIAMAAYANNSSTWPDDNIRALASEYTSTPWDDNLSPGWPFFVFEAYRDVQASGVFPVTP